MGREVYERRHGKGVKREWLLSQLTFTNSTAPVAESAKQLKYLVTTEFGILCERRKLRVDVKKKVMVMGKEGVASQV